MTPDDAHDIVLLLVVLLVAATGAVVRHKVDNRTQTTEY